MRVRIWGTNAQVDTTNVASFSAPPHFDRLVVDGTPVTPSSRGEDLFMIRQSGDAEWSLATQASARRGPLTAVLHTVGPLTIVWPSSSPELLAVATRLAHDLFVYLDLDVRILSDVEALDPPTLAGIGNVAALGDPFSNRWVQVFQEAMRTGVKWQARGTFTVGNRVFTESGDGLIFQAPHPLAPDRSAVVICGTDLRGILHAIRLFPLRTGVPAPDWTVVGDDRFEDGGVKLAGFWRADFSLGRSA